MDEEIQAEFKCVQSRKGIETGDITYRNATILKQNQEKCIYCLIQNQSLEKFEEGKAKKINGT